MLLSQLIPNYYPETEIENKYIFFDGKTFLNKPFQNF